MSLAYVLLFLALTVFGFAAGCLLADLLPNHQPRRPR